MFRFPVSFPRPVEVTDVKDMAAVRPTERKLRYTGMWRINIEVPANSAWYIKSMWVQCVSDNLAGNRQLVVQLYRDDRVVWDARSRPFPLTDTMIMQLAPNLGAFDGPFEVSNLTYIDYRPWYPGAVLGTRDYVWVESQIVGANDLLTVEVIVDEVNAV